MTKVKPGSPSACGGFTVLFDYKMKGQNRKMENGSSLQNFNTTPRGKTH